MSETAAASPLDEPPAALARGLIRRAASAALATVRPDDGWPYGSLVLVACDHDASPLLLISKLAEHSRNLAAEARLSLLYDATAGLDDPLAGARLTVLGRATPSSEPRHRARFLNRHPEAAAYADFGDFAFYRVAVSRAHLVAGFGRITWIEGEELLIEIGEAAELMEAEAEILAHMNADHAEAVALYARVLGAEGGGWRLVGCDPEGCDLLRGGSRLRLPFATRVRDAAGARAELVAAARRARQS